MNDPLNLTGKNNEDKDDRERAEFNPLNIPKNKDDNGPASRIERLQNKLYSPNTQFQIRKRKTLQKKNVELKDSWEKERGKDFSEGLRKGPGLSIFAKLAIFAFIFFVGSVSYALFIFNSGQQTLSGNDVEVTVVGPVSVGGGEELTLDIIIENNNSIPIYTVDLVLEYPDGTKSFTDLRTDLPRIRDGLGDIAPNTVVKKSYSAALFGQEGDQKTVDVHVEYRLPGSTAIFERGKTFVLSLQSSPIRLAVDTVFCWINYLYRKSSCRYCKRNYS